MRKKAPRTSGDRVLRAAIIGCGRIAGGFDEGSRSKDVRTHAKAYTLEPATRLVAVADTDPRKGKTFGARWGKLAVYTDAVRMLVEERPDVVSICTPDEAHAPILEACLECGSVKAIWCEKPLATDLGRAQAIVARSREKGVVLAVNYQRRWDPHIQRVTRALARGELGEIQKVVVFYSKGILHNGSHAVDLLLQWFGSPRAIQVLGSHVDFTPEDPTVDARVFLGDLPVFLVGMNGRAYGVFEIHLMGTLGRIGLTNFGRRIAWFRVEPTSGLDGSRELLARPTVYVRKHTIAMSHALRNIVRAMRTGQPVRSSGESALSTLKVCFELASRARRGEFHPQGIGAWH